MRALPFEKAKAMLCSVWMKDGILKTADGPFVDAAVELTQDSIELLTEASQKLTSQFVYPLLETLVSPDAQPVQSLPHRSVILFVSQLVEDDIQEVFEVIVADYESGELQSAIANDAISVQPPSILLHPMGKHAVA